jgi:hypothetical protein
VEKNQYKLCLEVLRRFHKVGILDQLVLIGSWCIPFYKEYFAHTKYLTSIRTRDVDFLIPNPNNISVNVDVTEAIKDLGFIVGLKGTQGIVKLEHPELTIEFLVPDKGKGFDKPVELPNLGVNAQALRFLNFLIEDAINVKIDDIHITIPHPINFALHKLIIYQRRKNKEKAEKDLESAIRILNAVIDNQEIELIRNKFKNIPKGWQRKIISGLKKADENKILDILTE